MKKLITLIIILSTITAVACSMASKKRYVKPGKEITMSEEYPMTLPGNLKRCIVYNKESLQDAINRATWHGACEEIILKPGSDLYGSYIAIQFDKPLIIADRSPTAVGSPLIVTNATGKFVIFKKPRNQGCSVIIKKPQVVFLGFSFEGALCYDEDLSAAKPPKAKPAVESDKGEEAVESEETEEGEAESTEEGSEKEKSEE